MSTGIQIAFEFPETSPLTPISPENTRTAHREVSERTVPARTSGHNLRTLGDLLGAIASTHRYQPAQVAMLRSTSAHISRYLNLPPERIEIATLADSLEAFRCYLVDRRFKRNSTRTYINYARLLIREAKAQGWCRLSPGLMDEWREVLPITKRCGCSSVVRYALRRGLRPSEFSDAHLDECLRSMITDGRTHTHVLSLNRRFRYCVFRSGLSSVIPNISPFVFKPRYGVRLSEFPEPLRTEVLDLLRWKTELYVDDRPIRSKRLRPASAARLKENLCQLYGFAKNIKGFNPRTLAELFGQDCLGEFLKWSESERKVKISTLTGSLWMILAIVRDYPLLQGRDSSWVRNRLAAMQGRIEDSESGAAEMVRVDHDTLARIPGLIRKEAQKLGEGRGKKRAILIRDELLFKFLLVLAWRQRNVRECKLGKRNDGANLFKEEVPPHSRISLPKSAVQALSRDPLQGTWQFCFRREETKAGRSVHAALPGELIPLLEEYLEVARPILVGNRDPGTLFVNDHGQPFETSVIRQRIENLTLRFIGAKVTPHQFRHAFAFKWLKKRPDDYLTLSKLLWHSSVDVTIRIYGRDFNESYAICRLEDLLEEERRSSSYGSEAEAENPHPDDATRRLKGGNVRCDRSRRAHQR